MLGRSRLFKRRRCPHIHLQGLYGDVVNAVGGWRLQCTDCWAMLDGHVGLSRVNRDPEGLHPAREDFKYPQTIGL